MNDDYKKRYPNWWPKSNKCVNLEINENDLNKDKNVKYNNNVNNN